MKYTFDTKIPYEFKDITGLEKGYGIGHSIVEDGKNIGGVSYEVVRIPSEKGSFFKVLLLTAIELLPEYRNHGIGNEIIQQLLTEYDCINACVQNEQAWKWWQRMGAMEYMAIFMPEDKGKINPKAHTLGFVLGRDKINTLMFKINFQLFSAQFPGAQGVSMNTEVDFSINNNLKK